MTELLVFLTRRWHSWLLTATLMTTGFYLTQLAMLVIRFMQWPNYINVHDWVDNIILIAQSTPSITDMLNIMQNEWLFEIGYMSYDYGMGISVWSLYIAPAKVIAVFAVSCLIATNFLLAASVKQRWPNRFSSTFTTANSLGAVLYALTSITLTWVVCCSTPTWIVGLAILGVGVTTSLQLEVLGPWLTAAGLGLLVLCNIALLRQMTANRHRQSTLQKRYLKTAVAP